MTEDIDYKKFVEEFGIHRIFRDGRGIVIAITIQNKDGSYTMFKPDETETKEQYESHVLEL